MTDFKLFHTLEFTVTYPLRESNKVENWSSTFDTMEKLELEFEMLLNRWDDYDDPTVSNVLIDGVPSEVYSLD